mmetsp:Transcript_19705/g.25515  ORF Transcript_19705/g.25515 Transcript_19705/m.25515 type:complete len:194 (+) Transcript_19705:111-692(+)
MLTNGETPSEIPRLPQEMALMIRDRSGNENKMSDEGDGEETQDLTNQLDAHFQVFHHLARKETMLCGISWQFDRKELSLVLATKDMHVYDGKNINIDIFVSFMCDCVFTNATLPITIKTNFGYPAEFKSIETLRPWLSLNLQIVLSMKSLWSGRTTLPATYFSTPTDAKNDDSTSQVHQELSSWKRVTDMMFY